MFRIFATGLFFAVSFLAISAATAQPLLPPQSSVPDAAGAEPGFLGMVADDRQAGGRGALIQEVEAGGPAASGGLRQGDLITAINGQAVHSLDDMAAALQNLPPAAKVVFDVDREGAAQHITVTLGRRPPPDQRRFQNFGKIPVTPPGQSGAGKSQPENTSPISPMGPSSRPGDGAVSGALLGVRAVPVTEATRLRLGLQSTAGAHVVARALRSPAERANIPLDSVIVAVNGERVTSPTDFSAMVTRAGVGSEIELTYIYNGKSARAGVVLGSTSPSANGMGAAPRPGIAEPSGVSGIAPAEHSDAQRIEALERRVRELEQKIRLLEDRLQRGA